MNEGKTVLVTGVNGFVGPHVVLELKKQNCKVIGLGYDESITPKLAEAQIAYQQCDLTNPESVAKIDFTSVDAIIHLAGLASQAMSFDQPQRFISDNSAMLINLCETALKQSPTKLPRFVVISSGAVYDSNQAMPLTEQSNLADNSPYVISKRLNENLCSYYKKRGIEAITVRPFNHTGPGQVPGYLIPDLVQQVIKAGKDGTIQVGNLTTRRDYSDVRDIVRGYVDLALAPKLEQSVFNICSGKSLSGKEILTEVTNAIYGDSSALKIEVDQSKIRPTDPGEIFGDNSAIRAAVGWEPTISIQTTIRDYIEWYTHNVQQAKA